MLLRLEALPLRLAAHECNHIPHRYIRICFAPPPASPGLIYTINMLLSFNLGVLVVSGHRKKEVVDGGWRIRGPGVRTRGASTGPVHRRASREQPFGWGVRNKPRHLERHPAGRGRMGVMGRAPLACLAPRAARVAPVQPPGRVVHCRIRMVLRLRPRPPCLPFPGPRASSCRSTGSLVLHAAR
jgi:hypothetical protein